LVGSDRFHVGGLSVRDDRVAALTSPPRSPTARFAIPGLRNAHVHLDLSLVRGVPRADAGFAPWVLDLLRRRGPFDPTVLQRAAAVGARECLATGTTAVIDVDSSGAAAAAVAASGLGGASCREVLGKLEPKEVDAWVERFPGFAPGGRLRPGLSPHAPYSTTPTQYRATRARAERDGLTWTTHLAETEAERELLRRGTGELRDLLDRLGAPPPFGEPPGAAPVRYLREIDGLPVNAVLAHVNHPDEGDEAVLAGLEATVVYCPRSHAFFGHPPHPLRRLRDGGVTVVLGTDSRASNASLSMLDEMAFLRAARPDLAPAELFEMATARAAPIVDGGTGRLEPGAPADLVVVESSGGLPDGLDDALDRVTRGSVRVIATIVSGVVCHAVPGFASDLPALTPPHGGLLSADS
ncbi:MAG: amidohydrolase family protein, partial [Planctomycetota bacterium JB042]